MNEKPGSTSASTIPLVIGAVIIVGGLTFLFRYDAIKNRFTNAPEKPFETIPIHVNTEKVTDPAISPDGASLAFVAGDSESLDLRVRTVGIERDVVLTDTPALERHPAWSPDGKRIAFARTTGDTTEIVVVPFRGGSERTVRTFTGEISDLTWCSDTLFFAERTGSDQPWHIGSLELESLAYQRITSPSALPGDREVAVSPDGTEIVFARAEGDVENLFLLRTGNDDLRQLTSEARPIHGVAWAAETIAYSVGETDRATIWKISPATGLRTAELRTSGAALDPSLSSDGSRIAYRRADGQLEVLAQ